MRKTQSTRSITGEFQCAGAAVLRLLACFRGAVVLFILVYYYGEGRAAGGVGVWRGTIKLGEQWRNRCGSVCRLGALLCDASRSRGTGWGGGGWVFQFRKLRRRCGCTRYPQHRRSVCLGTHIHIQRAPHLDLTKSYPSSIISTLRSFSSSVHHMENASSAQRLAIRSQKGAVRCDAVRGELTHRTRTTPSPPDPRPRRPSPPLSSPCTKSAGATQRARIPGTRTRQPAPSGRCHPCQYVVRERPTVTARTVGETTMRP